MIGNDSTSDIAGAKAVGMDALYVRTAISPENDPVPDCKYVLKTEILDMSLIFRRKQLCIQQLF